MIELLQNIIQKFINLAYEFFEYVFGDVQFDILWSWLPEDIQQAAQTFIVILFAVALIKLIRNFLPF